ncbi:MAG: hypothetical protein ACMXYF_03705 [Candidatus Woesearchaeota archaeon]
MNKKAQIRIWNLVARLVILALIIGLSTAFVISQGANTTHQLPFQAKDIANVLEAVGSVQGNVAVYFQPLSQINVSIEDDSLYVLRGQSFARQKLTLPSKLIVEENHQRQSSVGITRRSDEIHLYDTGSYHINRQLYLQDCIQSNNQFKVNDTQYLGIEQDGLHEIFINVKHLENSHSSVFLSTADESLVCSLQKHLSLSGIQLILLPFSSAESSELYFSSQRSVNVYGENVRTALVRALEEVSR